MEVTSQVALTNARTLVLQLRKAAAADRDPERRGKLRDLAWQQEAIVAELARTLAS